MNESQVLSEVERLLQGDGIPEADVLLRQACHRFPLSLEIWTHWARLSCLRRLHTEPAHRWKSVLARFPQERVIYREAALALAQWSSYDDAEQVITEGIGRFGNRSDLMDAWIEVASTHQKWSEAVRRSDAVRQSLPEDVVGYLKGAEALVGLQREIEASQLLEDTLKRFPFDAEVAATYVRLTSSIVPNRLTLERCAGMRERHPDRHYGYLLGARYARQFGDAIAGEALATDCIIRFPMQPEAWNVWAEMAACRGELDVAIERYTAGVERFALDYRLTQRLAESLCAAQRLREARAVFGRALKTWPQDLALLSKQATLSLVCGSPAEAAQLWESVRSDLVVPLHVVLDLAWSIFSIAPPSELFRPMLLYLANERDAGDPHWVPRLASMKALRLKRPELADFARNVIDSCTAMSIDPVTSAVLKSALLFDFSDHQINEFIREFVAASRLGLTAHMFSQYYWKPQSSRFHDFARLFGDHMERKWADAAWVEEPSWEEVLSYLTFSAVFAPSEFDRLISFSERQLGLANRLSPPTLTSAKDVVMNITTKRVGGNNKGAGGIIPSIRRLRIAVCVSGQLRGFRQAYPSWSQLGFDEHDTTLFVHVWRSKGYSPQRTWEFTRGNPFLYALLAGSDGEAFLRRRYPILARALGIVPDPEANGTETIERDELSGFYGTQFVRIEDESESKFVDKDNQWKMHYKIEQAFYFAMEDNREFDLVIRIRPDLEIKRVKNLDFGFVCEQSRSRRTIFTDQAYYYTERQCWIGDMFAAGTPEIMTVYSTVFSSMINAIQNDRVPLDVPKFFRPHTNLFYFSFYNGILGEAVPGTQFGDLLDEATPTKDELRSLLLADQMPLMSPEHATRPT